ncbi:Hypothetical protein FKW44_010709 [Caligus rogercresseyi]|uniref:Uncharacterized protein n=1 Tax=Caligus rogercresseyi TaxID=217165 RepID=A0A7T8HI02_CALRO|nr:Hypothetical protein FKW44_010709 [Caligus rogercresseyi]
MLYLLTWMAKINLITTIFLHSLSILSLKVLHVVMISLGYKAAQYLLMETLRLFCLWEQTCLSNFS